MKPKVGVFHPGTQHAWQTSLAFQENNQLSWFLTSIYFSNSVINCDLWRVLPVNIRNKLKRELRRRHSNLLDEELVVTAGSFEWLEILSQRLGFIEFARKFDSFGNRKFYKHVSKQCSRSKVDILWGFNNSSLETFKYAKDNGIKCVLDQTIGHPSSYNEIISAEMGKYSKYFFSGIDYCKSPAVLRRNTEECILADLVVVGSQFCAETMVKNGCPESKIKIIPYGFDETIFGTASKADRSEGVLRFIFVGSVIPRKGIHYLIEAFKKIDSGLVELLIVGGVGVPKEALFDLPSNIKLVGSVPRHEVVQYYQESDVFIFPSLFEGGGIVLYEACAAGLAIIQTNACGDGVRSGNGVVLESVSVASLVSVIKDMMENRESVNAMKNQSIAIKNERSWAKYRADVRQVALDLFK